MAIFRDLAIVLQYTFQGRPNAVYWTISAGVTGFSSDDAIIPLWEPSVYGHG